MTRFVWATVSSISPVRVTLDGDTAELPIALDALVDPTSLSVGDRVRCEWAGRRLILHGRSGGERVRSVTYTTSSLANGATEVGMLELGAGFTILRFKASHAARFRAYQSVAHRTADAARVVGVFPSGDHGLIFEDDGSAAEDYATVVVGGLLEGTSACPVSITNRSGTTRSITVELEVRV